MTIQTGAANIPAATITVSGLDFGVGETLATAIKQAGSDPSGIISNIQVTGADSFSFDFVGRTTAELGGFSAAIDITTSVVPLPASALLFFTGLAGVAVLRRRQS